MGIVQSPVLDASTSASAKSVLSHFWIDLANVNSMLRFMLTSGYAMGNGIHIVKAKVRARMVQQ